MRPQGDASSGEEGIVRHLLFSDASRHDGGWLIVAQRLWVVR